ncbi:transcription factor MYB101-like isoform X2 [Wolffia australiana]
MPDGPCNGAVAAEKVTASKGSPSSSCSSGGGGERVGMKKGPWTASEDAILVEYVKRHGEGNWNAVQRNSGLQRCGKSCRLRWANHLRPNLRKGPFSPQEERLILELHAKIGNKWARMAAQLPGRTDNEIKNYWNTRIKRRQRAGLPLYPLDLRRPSPPNPSPNPPLFPSAVHLRPSFSPPLCWTFAAREPLFFDVGLQKLALGEAPLPSIMSVDLGLFLESLRYYL